MYDDELLFEHDLVTFLFSKGWDTHVIKNPTEEQLIDNWAEILYRNNRSIDCLGDYPLTRTEMQQIIEQINLLRTPLALNGFINGKSVLIIRDNPDDKLHFGKQVSLSIYDRNQIASGTSVYQIVEQPIFPTYHPLASDRRGDLMLLINGMPVIHVELKRSKVAVSQAVNQIQKYYHRGIFSQGIFALVQVFVAMNPEDAVYFANPGSDQFSPQFQFHWADFNNEPLNDWKSIATHLLSIPMAHQLIGFYTVADKLDGNLKVMRSYQYYAASAISDRVAKCKWDDHDIYGGYIWHTTGSGKTMTSFKSAQLVSDSGKADKVVFLIDRIELGTQSALEYRGFMNENEEVQETEDTRDLISKLKSSDPKDSLIVTSIQKMSRIVPSSSNQHDIRIINQKRIVIIIDEAHRDVFGDMLIQIRETFTRAIFFGFTGTPIHPENQRQMMTTNTIFGNELHRYSIADGIRDKNVLGFDPTKVMIFNDLDLRKEVALMKCHASTEEEALNDPKKAKVYYRYMSEVPMYSPGVEDCIENFIPREQYETDSYRLSVVEDIRKHHNLITRNRKFHAIFATSCILDAFEYYHLLLEKFPELNVTCLVDPSIDNNDGNTVKEDALLEILGDYNAKYDTNYKMPTYGQFKKDVSLRLAHKGIYKGIEGQHDKCIDILIVVDQMLTGFDSHWVNTLYMDKLLRNEHLIQAFSRTNRLCGPEKAHGVIRYYRKPHTMAYNIQNAVKLYSGDKPFGVFADHLEHHIKCINGLYEEIRHLFEVAGIQDFSRLPEDKHVQGQFAKHFRALNQHLNAARLQGFVWGQSTIMCESGEEIDGASFDETTYNALVQRYKEIFRQGPGGDPAVPFDVDPYITEINTGAIDTEYMNTRFVKYMRALQNLTSESEKNSALDELHRSFSTLSQEEQEFAEQFLHDVQRGEVTVDESKTLRDYITEYMTRAKDGRIHRFAVALGLDESLLRELLTNTQQGGDINEYGRLDALKATVDMAKAKQYLEEKEGKPIPAFRVQMRIDNTIRHFIETGGF